MNSKQSKQKVLLTGSSGCIGAWLIRVLLQKQHQVIAYDLSDDQSRMSLLIDDKQLSLLCWEQGDITDQERLFSVVEKHRPTAIIHLAALQVPFCIANPSLGAQVNVVGTINVLEAARHFAIKNTVYASSVAASATESAIDEGNLKTLYGAYKVCNEQTAKVYCNDWAVASIGIRLGVVYGVARDQGMSALPTLALLAGCLNEPYTVNFRGTVGFVYAENIARVLLQASQVEHNAAKVFDYHGHTSTVEQFMVIAQQYLPNLQVSITGEALPFPAQLSNQPLMDYIGQVDEIDLRQGIKNTIVHFQKLIEAGKLNKSHLKL